MRSKAREIAPHPCFGPALGLLVNSFQRRTSTTCYQQRRQHDLSGPYASLQMDRINHIIISSHGFAMRKPRQCLTSSVTMTRMPHSRVGTTTEFKVEHGETLVLRRGQREKRPDRTPCMVKVAVPTMRSTCALRHGA
jgi:hypothetical protein